MEIDNNNNQKKTIRRFLADIEKFHNARRSEHFSGRERLSGGRERAGGDPAPQQQLFRKISSSEFSIAAAAIEALYYEIITEAGF